MDTNPFATNPGTAGAATPSYLQPQGPTTSMPGNISNMVKAIMAGNAQHQAQQQKQGALLGQSPINNTTTGGPSVGAPMSLAPPTSPAGMTGGAGNAAPSVTAPSDGVGSPMGNPMASPMGGAMLPPGGGAAMPGMPNGIDPTMAALFSQIPGQGGQGG